MDDDKGVENGDHTNAVIRTSIISSIFTFLIIFGSFWFSSFGDVQRNATLGGKL